MLDTETTGLKRGPDGARLTEVAAFAVDLAARRIFARFNTLIDPGIPIPLEASEINGISDETVRGCPKFYQVWPRLEAFVRENCPTLEIIAHRASFDRGMIEDSLDRMGATNWPAWQWRDSIDLAKKTVPGLSSYALSDRPGVTGLRTVLGLGEATAHRAAGDAMTLCKLLGVLKDRNGGKPFDAWKGPAIAWVKPEKKSGKKQKKVTGEGTLNLFDRR